MSNVPALPQGFGAPSKLFAGHATDNDELGAGVAASYGVIGYRGKVWSIKYQGKEIPLMREDGDGARASIEVVIVKAAAAISKIYYANGYQDGSNTPPDCWSSDGIKPDASCAAKQHPTCAACPRNAWGSRVTEAGKQGKQCADSRRIAVVPSNDVDNEAFGGPMLLRVPAASLKDLKAYGEYMKDHGFQYYAVSSRISFDVQESFPKFVFSAIKPLTDAQAKKVLELRGDRRVTALLNETMEAGSTAAAESTEEVPASPFEQSGSETETSKPTQSATAATSAKSSTSQKAVAATATKTDTATKAPAKATTQTATSKVVERMAEVAEEETEEVTTAGNVPSSFDELLDDIL